MANREQEAELIRARIRQWVETVKTGDGDKVAQFYTRSGKFLPPNQPIASGRQEIANAWNGLLKMPNVKLTFGPVLVEVAESCDLGYDIGTYKLGFDGPNGRVEDEGKYVVVWRKEDGEWRAAADILNTSKPAG